MIEIDPKRFRTESTPEQLEGSKFIIKNKNFCLFDRPGFGKTKQVIDASCVLYEAEEIDTVVVVCPASVQGVWDEPDLGELTKHCWIPFGTTRFRRDCIELPTIEGLLFVIVSYGFLRKKSGDIFPEAKRLRKLLKTRKPIIILDESSYIKSKDSSQYKSCLVLGESIERKGILNGTPVCNGVVDLFPQFNFTDDRILTFSDVNEGLKPLTFPQFRARFCITELRSFPNRRPFIQILGDNKEAVSELRIKAKPWILRRNLNLPIEKLYSHREVTLSDEEWKAYVEMREQLVAWFENQPSAAKNGAVKTLRLSQITSGFLGGLVDLENDVQEDSTAKVVEIGSSKQAVLLEYIETLSDKEQAVIWCRFRPEIERLTAALRKLGYSTGQVYGGISKNRKDEDIKNFQLGNLQFLVGQSHSGGLGLNLQMARLNLYLSDDFSFLYRDQSEQRVFRRGQDRDVLITDYIAYGPRGQKTIDFEMAKARRNKQDTANWTCSAWLNVLKGVA